MQIRNKFIELVMQASEICENHLDIDAEPHLAEILDFVIQNYQSKSVLESAFVEILNEPILAAPEIVEYCMFELRWSHVKRALVDRARTEPEIRRRRPFEAMLESFEDDWEGANSYKRHCQSGIVSENEP